MTTREVIEKYYECVNGGDWNTWLSLFTDDVSGDEQLAGSFEGIDILRGAIGDIQHGYSKFLMHPQHIVVQGEEACVIWRCDAANHAGTPIAYNYLPNREVVEPTIFAWRAIRSSICELFMTKQRLPRMRILVIRNRPLPRRVPS